MKNTSPGLPWSESVISLTKMSHKMKRSGYPASWRRETFLSAISKYTTRRKDDQEGRRPLYRPREWMEEERRLNKAKKRQNWAKKQAKDDELARAPLIIFPSDGKLTEDIKKVCTEFGEKHNIHIPVSLRGGKRVSSVVKAEPFGSDTCGRANCVPCISGGGGDCERSSSGYKIDCMECSKEDLVATHHGETGRNGYSRGLEHVADLGARKSTSPLWKHCEIQHGGRVVDFKMTCLKSFKSSFIRQTNEGVRIVSSEADICMNSRTEFHQPSIIRVTPTLGNPNEEQTIHPRGRVQQ